MKAVFALAWLAPLVLVGCGETTNALVRLDIADKLRQPCPVELPVLASADDADNLKWSQDMLQLYVACANDKKAVVEAIDKYNAQVVEKNKVKIK